MGDTASDAVWRRRYERERTARLEAESIGEAAIAALTAANQALDLRVAERTAQLEAMLIRLEAADEAKNTFLRGVAHEMATPLHAIRGFLELIADQDVADEVRRPAREAGLAAKRLHEALRTLVEFAAVTATEIHVDSEPISLGSYGDDASSRWRLRAAREGKLLLVEVAPDPETVVRIDPVRVDQIVDALLDNAIRYGGSRIVLRLSAEIDESAAMLRVAVIDDGPGVRPGSADEDVFEAFVRGTSHADSGFGVGLTLARAVSESLGGSLCLEPEGDGAHFEAVLPAAHGGGS